VKGNLKLLALKYLKEDDKLSGTEIIQKLEKTTGWKPSPGTLYPLLDNLEQKKLLKSEKQGRQRKFQITEKGEQRFEEFQKEQEKYWGQIIQSLKNYKEMFEQEELENFIEAIDQARKGNYESPYAVMVCYKIIDKIQATPINDTQEEKINKILDQALEEIEEELE